MTLEGLFLLAWIALCTTGLLILGILSFRRDRDR